ncbi:hypothetical protein AK812_SmicGene7208 [Symbiodinium microadriaticum]|uniref:Uncharacterized protein n=1 Tax=Symbiodinium microadriaticum TaxID=2951 RepID=A0A1Q9EP36_SYMMI|nr:hypothetical protein AK812_SmicGene7208 [Symbiodinium microadriaticum]
MVCPLCIRFTSFAAFPPTPYQHQAVADAVEASRWKRPGVSFAYSCCHELAAAGFEKSPSVFNCAGGPPRPSALPRQRWQAEPLAEVWVVFGLGLHRHLMAGTIPWSTVRQGSVGSAGWQPEPMEFLSDLHSNPFVFPFEECFPPESPATFVRCCNARWRHQLPNQDCWGRPFLSGAQAKYLQRLHGLKDMNLSAETGDLRFEAGQILKEVSRYCPDGECHEQHWPYDSLPFLQQLRIAHLQALGRLREVEPGEPQKSSRLEYPSPSEFKRWLSWKNRSLTNPMDCCGLEVETQKPPKLFPAPFLDEYYEQKWPPALTAKNRVGRDLFSCQSVLSEVSLHELVVLYIRAGSPAYILRERKALPPRAHARYLKWSERCAHHYSTSDRPQFWTQSLLSFKPDAGQAEPQQDPLFMDILPADSATFPEGRAASKRFGVLANCAHRTRKNCRLAVGLWQCYRERHSNDTEIWYREQTADFHSETDLRCSSGARVRDLARQCGTGLDCEGTGQSSFHYWRTSFNALTFSSMCMLHHDALLDNKRTKVRVGADVFGRYEWHLLVDGGDVSIGPGCFGESLSTIISMAPLEAEIIIKDPSDLEDSNGGVVLVRRSPLGKLFLDLMLDKTSWPLQLIGSGCYCDQPSMNEAILEIVAWETGAEYNSDCLPHLFVEPNEDGNFGCHYMTHLLCFKTNLRRMTGPFGNRSTRKIYFLPPHRAADINFRPSGNVPDRATEGNLAHFHWRPFLWHWNSYQSKHPVMLKHHGIEENAHMTLPPYPSVEDRSVQSNPPTGTATPELRAAGQLVTPMYVCQYLAPDLTFGPEASTSLRRSLWDRLSAGLGEFYCELPVEG